MFGLYVNIYEAEIYRDCYTLAFVGGIYACVMEKLCINYDCMFDIKPYLFDILIY